MDIYKWFYNNKLIICWVVTQADYRLPEGTYDLFARIKDTNQIANDVELEVYNKTDTNLIVLSKQNVISTHDIYTTSSNEIHVDFLGFTRIS